MNERRNQNLSASFPFADLKEWSKFYRQVRFTNRFSLDENGERFIAAVLRYAKQYKMATLQSNASLFRARINNADDHYNAWPIDKMGAPPVASAGHGRINPRGIPYLYLASDKETAVSEVRPWIGCRLTVAEFRLNTDKHMINFRRDHAQTVVGDNKFNNPVVTWRELISWMFSAPFDPRDDTAYVPTQYLAERIKREGIDGIMYDSALNPDGYNIAFFDTTSAEPIGREVAEVKTIKLQALFRDIE
jgi:RES domain-containing protein